MIAKDFMMRFSCLPYILIVLYKINEFHCKKANLRHHQNSHTFETRVTKSKHDDVKEKFDIMKREGGLKGSVSTLKRYDIADKGQEKSTNEKTSKITKNIIQPANAFSHLSDLLGLKGSFIPNHSKQRWIEDEEDSGPNSNEDVNPYAKQLDEHRQTTELGVEKGTLPLDMSPQQVALITSTADNNMQRRKFLQWEKEGGSMDTRHFPSTYIEGEHNVQGSIDTDASKRVSTGGLSSNEKQKQASKAIQGVDDTLKQNENMQKLSKEGVALNEVGDKDKKGFMGYLANQLGMIDDSHSLKNELTTHSFLGTAFHSANEQPLSHEMINKLQLDPAWDAMEAKILAQNGRRLMQMPLPVNKIDREMMPPLGEPVGQAYLPNGHQTQTNLISNFHKPAGFMVQPLGEDLHPSSYHSHFQPTDQGLPQTINIGGSLVHAFGDPWKNLKQTTYDHAEDNFPLARINQQLPAQSASSPPSSASSAAAEEADGEVESVGKPLTKVKGKLVKEKETSKAVESKNDPEDLDIKIGKGTQKKKPNLVLVKGKKFGKKQSKQEDNDDDSKQGRKVERERKVKLNSHLKEKNREDDDDEIEAKISEDDGEDSKEINQKGQEQKFLLSENTDDGQGPRFSQQESNDKEKQTNRVERQPHMRPGNNAGKSKAEQNEYTGKYITHKFVNFLSDVAQHLNVDKLSIAEQLVQDVEDSKRKKARKDATKMKENEAINDLLQRLQTKRRSVASQHDVISAKNGKEEVIGGLRIRRKQPTVIKYIWNKGISVLKETR